MAHAPPIIPGQRFSLAEYESDGRRLGHGAYAIVYKGRNRNTGEPVAIKEINCTQLLLKTPNLKRHLDAEINIMKLISSEKHENIVSLLYTEAQSSPAGDFRYLVLDFCDSGNLTEFLSRQKGKKVSEKDAKELFIQLANGLAHLRKYEISHRDLKPQNLLLSHVNQTFNLKIADFGFARHIKPQGIAETLCGTPLYMAPEILKREKYTDKADLWSIGVILYEILCGGTPFNARSIEELITKLRTQIISFPQHIGLSENCKDLIMHLLQKDSSNRISWESFFSHPWFDNRIRVPLAKPLAQPGLNPFKPAIKQEDRLEIQAALAVAQLGDFLFQKNETDKALSLYLKALQDLKKIHSSYDVSSYEKEKIKGPFSYYLGICQRLFAEKVRPAGLAEYWIFEWAKWYGEQGTIKELTKLYSESKEFYQKGKLLLQQLLFDVATQGDREILEQYITMFKHRIVEVEKYL